MWCDVWSEFDLLHQQRPAICSNRSQFSQFTLICPTNFDEKHEQLLKFSMSFVRVLQFMWSEIVPFNNKFLSKTLANSWILIDKILPENSIDFNVIYLLSKNRKMKWGNWRIRIKRRGRRRSSRNTLRRNTQSIMSFFYHGLNGSICANLYQQLQM